MSKLLTWSEYKYTSYESVLRWFKKMIRIQLKNVWMKNKSSEKEKTIVAW